MTKKEKEKRKKKIRKAVIVLALGSACALWAAKSINIQKSGIELISYTEYMELLNEGMVNTVVYNDENEYMTISLHNADTVNMTEEERENYDYNTSQLRKVIYPAGEDFKKDLLEQGVVVMKDGASLNTLFDKYGTAFLYLVMLIGILILMRKTSAMSLTKDVAAAVSPEEIKVTFDDVIGHEEIKDDLKLLVKQMKQGDKMKDLSHGVLFEGGAGTGKTMLAKAIAKEAGVNFISVNSSSLVQMYVGLGAKRVRDIFAKARKNSPCVLFFDELDAIGEQRGSQRSHRENDQTINALLTELDGFGDRGNILVIAATNRADTLDAALVRAGRFDRKVKIEAPKKWETRKQLFDRYLRDYSISDDVDTEMLAKQTVGFSGADIASICREARLVMFAKDGENITQDNLEEAIDKVVFRGSRSNEKAKQKETEIVAYHEAGHAVMTMLCGKEVNRISVKGMTSGVGGAVFQSDDDTAFHTKQAIEEQIMICYAGRASEEIKFGAENISDGAGNDIQKATTLLSAYVGKYGFGRLGLLDLEALPDGFKNENLFNEVANTSTEIYENTVALLENSYDKVEMLAQELIKKTTLSGKEMEKLFGKD